MVVVYKCDEGYSLIGPSTRICQSNGEWSGEEPFCERKHAVVLWKKIIHDNVLPTFL